MPAAGEAFAAVVVEGAPALLSPFKGAAAGAGACAGAGVGVGAGFPGIEAVWKPRRAA